ncbi:MAG: hypothetical protein E7066_09935 [Lentimicrobiaceae bacterium]|nr:hypothetical protein [Lentimicrobiaceae bacterium]
MKKLLIYHLIVLFTITACNNNNINDYSYSPQANSPKSNHQLSNTEIYKVKLDSTIISSKYGRIGQHKDSLYFLDKYNSFLYYIDTSGISTERLLGIGNSSSEINCGPISTHTFTRRGELIIFGSSDDIYIYSSELRHKKDASFRLKRDRNKMAPEVEKNPDDFETYTFPRFIVCRTFGDKVYINNNSTAHGFNYFETPDKYAQSCRIITEYDIPNKKIGRLLGNGLPEMYKGSSDKNYVFSEFTFDIDEKGNFYIAFLADSLIYKFNKDFKPATAFGYKGKDMDTDYISITKPKDIYQKANEQYNTKGWYTWIEYIPEKNWLCRSYHKGDSHNYDGLQIYKDNILIADINVPVGFRPIGYIHPYLYSDAVVENDKLLFYKIKIE